MPYPGVPLHLTDQMEKCVAAVMKTGKSKSSAIAICHVQLMGKKQKNDVKGKGHLYTKGGD